MPLRALTRVTLGVCLCLAATALHAAPTINNVSLRGLQIGQTTQLILQGTELAGNVQLLAPFVVAKQEVLPGASGQQVTLAITLADDVAPGIYAVRLATPTGITPPLILGVDRLPQLPMAEQTNALPLAMTGVLSGGQILKFSFPGKKDQQLVVDLEAVRIGANFKPVVRLYDKQGKQLAYSPPKHNLGGDARVAVKLPADDTYTVELHDILYRAGGPGHFRLKVGELSFADFVLPQAITRGTKGSVKFAATNVPAATSAEIDATGLAFRTERASAAPGAPLFTGAQPRLLISEQSEAVETPAAAGQPQTLSALPCGVSGTIAKPGEEDQYLAPVTAGQKIRVDVAARRRGSLLDGVLIIRGAAGNELARNDDQPGTADPGMEFNVPAGVDKLLVCVRDMENRFSEEHIYHLSIRDAATGDFSVTVATDTIQVAAGGTVVVPVTLSRTNYNGPVRLEVQGLVGDVRLEGIDIPAGATSTLLTLTAKGGQPVHSTIQIIARALEPNVSLARHVLGPDNNGATRYQPWLRRDLGFAIAGDAPLIVEVDGSVEALKTFSGDRYPVALRVTRRPEAVGEVRLRLLTTQPAVKKKIKENNQDKEVDDTDRMLRLAEGTMNIKPDQAQATAEIQIPADLPAQDWGVVLVAELLSADGKTVVATANTSAMKIHPEAPLKLELTSTPQAEGRAGVGEAGMFTGKIERSPGFTKPVVVTLKGLPGEVKMVPQITLAADQTEFQLPLTFEYGSKPGEFKGVKLSASVEGSPLPSAATDVEVKIVPGEKPQ